MARDFDVLRHIRFGTEVLGATFDEQSGTWRLALPDGGQHEADVLITATGQLSRLPSHPLQGPVPGTEHTDVVVGNGFGGSIAALRPTGKGYHVAVLEAGIGTAARPRRPGARPPGPPPPPAHPRATADRRLTVPARLDPLQ